MQLTLNAACYPLKPSPRTPFPRIRRSLNVSDLALLLNNRQVRFGHEERVERSGAIFKKVEVSGILWNDVRMFGGEYK